MVDHASRGDVDVFWMVGGNVLETLPDRAKSSAALRQLRLRIHQDIVLSSAMLSECEGDVLLLPAATRYEAAGGGTETSTERRIIFSPEIPGRRIGSALPEWQVFREVARRVRPAHDHPIGLADAQSIRNEIGAAIPLYRGIESLKEKGDQLQWGGRTLYADGRFNTADGRARFSRVMMRPAACAAEGGFSLSTRRGKQFNSMVQRDVDPLTGASRDDILINAENPGLFPAGFEAHPSNPVTFRSTGPKAMCFWPRASILIRSNPTTTRASRLRNSDR
jgi:predicted molibdopterin-dependent oxidoreductase YjgC